MCDSTNLVPWFALTVSIGSLCFAGAGWCTNREKLRLDLYNRRFDIYNRTLDLLHALEVWNPTSSEKQGHSLQDSSDLEKALKAFTKASQESLFLFDNESGIHRRMEEIHSDAIGIIGYKRDIAPQFSGLELIAEESKFQTRMKRFYVALPSLEKALKKYLNFHSLNTLPWPDFMADTME